MGAALLAPFDGTVELVKVNSIVNTVGKMGKSPATLVVFVRTDGAHVVYAHLGSMKVKVGDIVHAGDAINTIGNNGQAKSPHTHVGARKVRTPLQIQFDLKARRN
ncbi:MAG: M23 family metallopeptidase [Gemmatimonas sp.]